MKIKILIICSRFDCEKHQSEREWISIVVDKWAKPIIEIKKNPAEGC
jgi:hypothetical protein